MIISIILIITFILFYFGKHHLGPSLLATLAGILVDNLFHQDITDFIARILPTLPRIYLEIGTVFCLIFIFPLILYFRQPRSGLSGLLRLAESILYTGFIFISLAPQLQLLLPFDQISSNLLHTITPFYNPEVEIGRASCRERV